MKLFFFLRETISDRRFIALTLTSFKLCFLMSLLTAVGACGRVYMM